MKNKVIGIMILAITPTLFYSCKKDWLNAKPDQSLVVPATLKDFQAMMDNTNIFNQLNSNLGELASDDYFFNSSLAARATWESDAYKWTGGNIFQGIQIRDWGRYYERIFYANNVLEGVEKIPVNNSNQNDWKRVKGTALFHRAFAYHHLAQLFCKQYDKNSSSSDLGLVLKSNANINEKPQRAFVEQTYNFILTDLRMAADLLPATVSFKTQPTAVSAYAMLARVYLSMNNYDSALYYSNKSIQQYGTLLNYNGFLQLGNHFTSNLQYANNAEILFFTLQNSTGMLPHRTSGGFVDSIFYKTYGTNDLRKYVFYDTGTTSPSPPMILFRGSYAGGTTYLFDGLANDEVYLIRAECYARKDKVSEAMVDLNSLLKTRWKQSAGVYKDTVAANAAQALVIILNERRKELCFRGLRWTDLRRLNLEAQFMKTLSRKGDGVTYTLPPNDPRYVFPIPDDEILVSHIEQNPR